MQSFYAAIALAISIPYTTLQSLGVDTVTAPVRLVNILNAASSYLEMLFHKDRNIKHAVQARVSNCKACASVGSNFSSALCQWCQFKAAAAQVAASVLWLGAMYGSAWRPS